MIRAAILILMLTVMIANVRAETLFVTLSDRTVDITSNFTGSAITVFGAIQRDASTVARASDYDVVVTVVGPPSDRVARLKERIFGIWINRRSRTFADVPSAYSVLSNRPVENIAHPALLQRFQIGVDALVPQDAEVDQQAAPDNAAALAPEANVEQSDTLGEDNTFARAFLRLKSEAQIYQEVPDGVSVINNNLFRARATFPADVPLGVFDVNIYLFSGGALLAEERVGILVRKTGFEQLVFQTSQRDPLIYGALAVFIAVFTGWLGSVVFRRS